MAQKLLTVRLLALATLLMASACHENGTEPRRDATVAIRADVSGTSVVTIVVDITAPDIATPLIFNIPVTGGLASGTITVPAGSNRTVGIQGYDAGGVETHSGSVTLNVQPGTNPTLSVVLQPLTGEVPIHATLGSITVTVTPAVDTLAKGNTVQLTASVTDWNGNPVVGGIAWATSDPGVALVDGSGLVTAAGAGTTAISATVQGAAGNATVTVNP